MYQCRKCKATWPDSLVDGWGENAQSDGLGADPVCPALVPGRGRHEDSHEVCRGGLVPAADVDGQQLLAVEPIDPVRRRNPETERQQLDRAESIRQERQKARQAAAATPPTRTTRARA